jgi:hypothetical protein
LRGLEAHDAVREAIARRTHFALGRFAGQAPLLQKRPPLQWASTQRASGAMR